MKARLTGRSQWQNRNDRARYAFHPFASAQRSLLSSLLSAQLQARVCNLMYFPKAIWLPNLKAFERKYTWLQKKAHMLFKLYWVVKSPFRFNRKKEFKRKILYKIMSRHWDAVELANQTKTEKSFFSSILLYKYVYIKKKSEKVEGKLNSVLGTEEREPTGECKSI